MYGECDRQCDARVVDQAEDRVRDTSDQASRGALDDTRLGQLAARGKAGLVGHKCGGVETHGAKKEDREYGYWHFGTLWAGRVLAQARGGRYNGRLVCSGY